MYMYINHYYVYVLLDVLMADIVLHHSGISNTVLFSAILGGQGPVSSPPWPDTSLVYVAVQIPYCFAC